jgi:hypothetical protein
MKKGTLITEQELLGYNWKFLIHFATCEVWGHYEDRILWERETHEIILVYKNRFDGT